MSQSAISQMARSAWHSKLLLAVFVLVTFLLHPTQEVRTLESGKPIERELASGQTHTYQITLQAGQFLRIVVEQKGIDVTVALLAPDGKQIAEFNLSSGFGLESLSYETLTSGNYRIAVSNSEPDTPKGIYQILPEVKAAATAQDKRRITAERLLAETDQLSKQEMPAAQKVLEKLQQVLLLWQELGDSYWKAKTLWQIGNMYSVINSYEKAIEPFEQALVNFREVKNRSGEIAALTSLGYAYESLSRYDKEIEYGEQALKIAREAKIRGGEAIALTVLSNAYRILSQYGKAIEYSEQALRVAREVRNRLGEGVSLLNIGAVYSYLNRHEKAIEYYEQALVISREMKDRYNEVATLSNLGASYDSLSQREKAIEYLEQALTISREIKDQYLEGSALINLGYIYSELGRYEKAIEYYGQALIISRRIKDRSGEGVALDNLGEVYRLLGRADHAIDYHEQALRIVREAKVRELEATVLNDIMLAWKTRNQPRLAIFHGKLAVNLFQEIRGDIRNLDRESQQGFLKSKEKGYRELADLLISQSRLPEAQQIINLLKEEEYFEFIRGDSSASGTTGRATLTPEEAVLEKRYREIADQLTTIGTERSALLEKDPRTPEEETRLAKLEEDLAIAGQVFQKFLNQLADEMGKSTEASAKVYNLREAQGLMGDLRELGSGVVVLYTLVGEEKYRSILITPDVQKSYEFPIKGADLKRKVLAFREVLQNPKLDPLPLAQELYRIMVGPVAADLRAAKAQTLMWSLDGVLRYLPPMVLHDGEQYLIERYRNIIFTPASSARLKDAPSKKWQALGLGVTKAHGDFEPLPSVLGELHGIIREQGAATTTEKKPTEGVLPGTVKLDETFTEASMLAGLRQHFPVVHIASHFQFKPGNETDSALLLGDGSLLSLAKIKSLPNVFSGVEMLTLSACDTATGSSGANGKEVESFGVLAQRQGAKAVIASLWPVRDYTTKVLMQEFYRLREAQAGTTKAEALRLAQLKLLRSAPSKTDVNRAGEKNHFPTPYAHPFYWAPFILIGNWK